MRTAEWAYSYKTEAVQNKILPSRRREYSVEAGVLFIRLEFWMWRLLSHTHIFTHSHRQTLVAKLKERPCTQPVWCPRRCEDTGSSPVCLWPPSIRPCRRRCSLPSNHPSSSRTTVAGNPQCLALSTQNYVLLCLVKYEAFCRHIILKRKVRKNRKWK